VDLYIVIRHVLILTGFMQNVHHTKIVDTVIRTINELLSRNFFFAFFFNARRSASMHTSL
jgi:hypothetical protein